MAPRIRIHSTCACLLTPHTLFVLWQVTMALMRVCHRRLHVCPVTSALRTWYRVRLAMTRSGYSVCRWAGLGTHTRTRHVARLCTGGMRSSLSYGHTQALGTDSLCVFGPTDERRLLSSCQTLATQRRVLTCTCAGWPHWRQNSSCRETRRRLRGCL